MCCESNYWPPKPSEELVFHQLLPVPKLSQLFSFQKLRALTPNFLLCTVRDVSDRRPSALQLAHPRCGTAAILNRQTFRFSSKTQITITTVPTVNNKTTIRHARQAEHSMTLAPGGLASCCKQPQHIENTSHLLPEP